MFARSSRVPSLWRVAGNLRCQSSTAGQQQEVISFDTNVKTGIATMKLNNKPVNCMALNFLKEFCDKMDYLEQQKVKGLIVTSVSNNHLVKCYKIKGCTFLGAAELVLFRA